MYAFNLQVRLNTIKLILVHYVWFLSSRARNNLK